MHLIMAPYHHTRLWPLPDPYAFIYCFSNAYHDIASFVASVSTIARPFLRDHKVQGQCILHASALLEILQDAANTLFAPSTDDLQVLEGIATGTPMEIDQQSTTISCTIDIALGIASAFGASTEHLFARIRGCIGALARECKIRAGLTFLHKGNLARRPAKAVFAEAIHFRESSECITRLPRMQAPMVVLHVASALMHNSAFSTIATCAAVVLKSATGEASTHCTGLPSASTEYKHPYQDLKCTSIHGPFFIHFLEVHLRLENKVPQERRASPTLQLRWQPTDEIVQAENHTASMPPRKWLILSDGPCSVGGLCCSIDMPIIATISSFGGDAILNFLGIHLNNEEDLLHLLSTIKADNCLLIKNRQKDKIEDVKRFSALAMLWVFRAYARASPSYKINLVTSQNHRECALPKSMLCQGISLIHTWHKALCICSIYKTFLMLDNHVTIMYACMHALVLPCTHNTIHVQA